MTEQLIPSVAVKQIAIVSVPVTAPLTERPKRRSQQKARFAVLIAVAQFLLLQLAFARAVQSEVLRLRDPIFFEKESLLSRAIANADAPTFHLAIGSSRTLLGFHPQRYSDHLQERDGQKVFAFNFGIPAAGTMTSTLYLHRLLGRSLKPDRILFEIHPGFVSTDGGEPFEARWLHPYRLNQAEMERVRGWGYAVTTPRHLTTVGSLCSMYDYRFPILDSCDPCLLPCPFGLRSGDRLDPLGWGPGMEPTPEQKPWLIAMARQEYAPVLDSFHPGGPGTEAIRDAIRSCRDAGIPLTLVVPPEASLFRSWYRAEGQREFVAWLQQLRDEEHADVIDARDWVPDDAFSDGHHLTQMGARIFTERLARERGGP